MTQISNEPSIKEFLLARIAEDEASAKAAAKGKNDRRMDISFPDPAGHSWTADQGMVSGEGQWNALWDCEGAESLCVAPAIAEHMARHDPARVLAECAAKRSIVEQAEEASSDRSAVIGEFCVGQEERDREYATDPGKLILEALAVVYSDHPDYRQEWAA